MPTCAISRAARLTLVDRTAAGAPLRDGVGEAEISPDGHHLVYVSGSPDAPQAPANDTHRTHLRRRSGSRHDGARRSRRRRHSGQCPSVQRRHQRRRHAGGIRKLSLPTSAPAPPRFAQVYVRDLVKSTTTWASVPQDANPMHADAGDPSLSRDGTRVAFDQFNPQFGFGMTGVRSGVRPRSHRSDDDARERRGGRGRRRAAVAERRRQPRELHDQLRADFPLFPQVFLSDLRAKTTTLVSVRRDGARPRAPRGVRVEYQRQRRLRCVEVAIR